MDANYQMQTRIPASVNFEELLLQFAKLNKNAERIRFVYEMLKRQNMLPSQSEVKANKDDVKAITARNEGNKHFVAIDYLQALIKYNESLCHATPLSEAMATAYGNRSAVYLKTGHYDFCLENIELALQQGCPKKLKDKLLKRKEECLELMNNLDLNKKFKDLKIDNLNRKVSLSYKANEKIPGVVECIDLVANEKSGRGLIAKKDLKPGDILILEEPYLKALKLDRVYSHCLNCLQSNFLNLIPYIDSNCVMFCSTKCLNESWVRSLNLKPQ